MPQAMSEALAAARRIPLRRMLRQLLAPLWPQLGTLAYLLRTMLAVGLALFVSFSLQLQSPMSSVTTVLIVANPLTGALVSKSLWRLFGTVLGASVAVALIAVFAQTPLLFTVALSLCIGLACVVSSLLRYFRAYGAVLAGYTIIIVTSGSYMDPQNIFTGALARVSAVSVGIVAAALVFLLTSLPITSTLNQTIESLVRDIAAGFMFYRRPEGMPDPSDLAAFPRPGLLERANALDEAIEYAGADSYVLRRRMGRLRLGAARLLGLLAALEPLHDGRMRHASPDADEAQAVARGTMAMLSQLPPGGLADSLPRIEAARDRVDALAAGITEPAALTMALHQRDVLEQLAHAVADLTGAGPADTRLRLRPYLEWAVALRNGMRGLLVTLIGGLSWYVTAWTSGPIMLSFLVPAACLLSTNPFASKASIELASGALVAIGASMLCQTFVLPQISGFPLLWGSLCLFLAPGIWLQIDPVQRNRAVGYVVFFNAMINVHNPITYDDTQLFNSWLAFLLGAFCLMMVFRVMLPANPPREVRRLAASLGRAVELLSLQRRRLPGIRLPGWEVWQNQQMQKILRLIQRLQQVGGADAAPVIQAAFVVVALGRAVLMLQALRRDRDLPDAAGEVAAAGLQALRRLRADPGRTAATLDALQTSMLPLLHAEPRDPDDPPGRSRAMHLLVGVLGEAALLIRKSQGLLTPGCPLFTYDAVTR